MVIGYGISFCGCTKLISTDNDWLYIIGSENVGTNTFVISVMIDGQHLYIQQIFADVAAFMIYLNTIFVQAYGLKGEFFYLDGKIYYENIEKFETGEVIYKPKKAQGLITEDANYLYIATEDGKILTTEWQT